MQEFNIFSREILSKERMDCLGDLENLIKFMKNNFKNLNNIVLWTSGLRLNTKEKIDRLYNAGITTLEIPLYGADPKIHDSITYIPGSFYRLSDNLKLISKLKIKLGLHVLVLKQNIYQLKEIFSFATKELNLKELYLWQLIPMYNKEDNSTKYYDCSVNYKTLADTLNSIADKDIELILFEFPQCVSGLINNKSVRFAPRETALNLRITESSTILRKMDYTLKQNTFFCSKCKKKDECIGLFDEYLTKHGSGGLEPYL